MSQAIIWMVANIKAHKRLSFQSVNTSATKTNQYNNYKVNVFITWNNVF